MRIYRHRVWDMLDDFLTVNIQVIPRDINKHANRLTATGSQFDIPIDI